MLKGNYSGALCTWLINSHHNCWQTREKERKRGGNRKWDSQDSRSRAKGWEQLHAVCVHVTVFTRYQFRMKETKPLMSCRQMPHRWRWCSKGQSFDVPGFSFNTAERNKSLFLFLNIDTVWRLHHQLRQRSYTHVQFDTLVFVFVFVILKFYFFLQWRNHI